MRERQPLFSPLPRGERGARQGSARLQCIAVNDTAQDFAIPAALPHRPAPHRPGARADYLRLAVARDATPALHFGRLQPLLDRPGVAAPAVDLIVLDKGDD